jgi:hypothetical protein
MEQIIDIIPVSHINLGNLERRHCSSFTTFSVLKDQ